MKNKLKKVIALFVSVLLVLTNIAVYANEDVVIDDASYEEVLEQPVVDLEISSEPQKLIYGKFVFGADADSNTSIGEFEYYSSSKDATSSEQQEDGTWIDVNKRNHDSLGNYTKAPDGTDAYFVTKYKRLAAFSSSDLYTSLLPKD